jgi:MFS family permease
VLVFIFCISLQLSTSSEKSSAATRRSDDQQLHALLPTEDEQQDIDGILKTANVEIDETANERSVESRPTTKPNLLAASKEILTYSKKISYIPYFWLFAFVMGAVMGMINNYLFLTLTDKLNASGPLLGVASIARIFLEVPFFFWSGAASKFILTFFMETDSQNDSNSASKVIGYRYVMVFSMAVLVARLLLYTLMSWFSWNPWIDVVVELLHGVIYAAFYSSAIQIASLSAPEHLQATSQGLFGAVYSGIGSTSGNLFGGIIYGAFGPTILFGIACLICGLTATLYLFDIKSSKQKQRIPNSV